MVLSPDPLGGFTRLNDRVYPFPREGIDEHLGVRRQTAELQSMIMGEFQAVRIRPHMESATGSGGKGNCRRKGDGCR